MPTKTPPKEKELSASKSKADEKVRVRALKTPVAVPGATLARGGEAIIDLPTATLKAEAGEITIIQKL